MEFEVGDNVKHLSNERTGRVIRIDLNDIVVVQWGGEDSMHETRFNEDEAERFLEKVE